jgi:hypothetical protein
MCSPYLGHHFIHDDRIESFRSPAKEGYGIQGSGTRNGKIAQTPNHLSRHAGYHLVIVNHQSPMSRTLSRHASVYDDRGFGATHIVFYFPFNAAPHQDRDCSVDLRPNTFIGVG